VSQQDKTWLVTGGAGFIGSQFIRLLLRTEPEARVVNVDALTYAGNPANVEEAAAAPGYRFVHADIRDAAAMEAAMQGVATVVHCAAESHVDRGILQARPMYETNVVGTQVLLDAARRAGVARFVYVSTDEVYGSMGPDGRSREEDALAPTSAYAASKAGGELAVRASAATHGLRTVITRGSNTYGPYQYPEKLVPLAIANAFDGAPVPLYGRGANVRDWIHVDDHCRGILAAARLGAPGGVYNLGGGGELDNLTLVRRLLALLGRDDSLIRLVADRPGHDFRYALDASRARAELGWRPEVELEAGLRATAAWYGGHRAWLERARGGAYRDYYAAQYGARLGTG
jgi:dTDP-glucose 4,6-dehydratase